MADNNESAVGAALCVTQTVALFTVMMPTVPDINRATGDPDHPFTSDVRQAELVAGGVSIAVGAIVSRLYGTWTPLVVSSLLVTSLIIAYEYTLRKPGASPTLVDMNRKDASNV